MAESTCMKAPPTSSGGFSLLELLIAVAVLAVILSVAMPSFAELAQTRRLTGLGEQLYAHLQQARSEAITRNTAVYANFAADGTTSWEYGISSANSLCDLSATAPTAGNACVLVVDDGDGTVDPGDGSVDADDLVLMRFTDAEYGDVTMSTSGFSSGNSQVAFDPVRGTASAAQIDLASASGRHLRLKVSLLGRITLCSPDGSVQNYAAAGC